MTLESQFDKMLDLCKLFHYGQVDKAGVPYLLHPLTVADKIVESDIELICIALGHDLIEDTDLTFDDLYGYEFSDRIIDGIKCLTKVKGESYLDYQTKVKSNSDAIKVKICDLEHNLDVSRLSNITSKDMERLKKYSIFYDELIKIEDTYYH